ncbi:MAG: DUF4982 domain-containing protein, partial [Clostridiales bacterium]|nr:DUF4982 domain-containing protein [Clostridiales bacterium]
LRLRNDLLDVDGSRLIAMGGDQQRTPATTTSTWGLVNQALDGYGLNYNTAPSVDGLIERFPDTFFFESESSSQTGARGVYFSPSLANTPPNQTPGNRGTSAYDNNFSSWTMPNEYGLKKDRDREAFIGQFIWSGFDYLGEPTPFGVYPVGVSSFGTVDTAGFPKDSYYLFKSQWTSEPMAHIVPMNWNDWQLGEDVEVWAYTNAIKAELFLNGRSLGVRSFDEKTTEFGLDYYETTEPTKDGSGSGYKTGADTNPDNPGGYVSPNGSYGKLHLTWHVPFEPGELKLVAMDKAGAPVAEDSLKTAKQAYAVELSAFEPQASENGLAYITAKVVDENGVMLPSANNLIKFDVSGNGLIVGVDNGKQESAELYKWGNVDESAHSERSAYNGLALAIVKAGDLGDGSSFALKASADNLFAAEIDVPVAAKGGTAEAPVQTRQLPKGELVSLAAKSVKAAKGSPIALPRDVLATYASGETRILKATWDSVPNESYAEAGTFEVEGSIEGVAQKAKISVTVAAAPFAKDYGLNTAAGAQDIVSADGALATASFTSGTNYPNYMLNGNTTNQWDNYAAAGQTVVLNAVNAARASDWVATYWPSEKTLSSISLYFTTNANYALPATINVQYWDGTEWANASNQAVAYATASNQATTVAFDSVATAKVRAVMTSAAPFDATTGRLRIVKFESYGPDFEAGGELAELAEALAGAIAGAGALTEADYTPATWQRLAQAVGAATTLLSGGGATAELLQAAIAEIAAATAELDEVADKAALAAQLALAEAITDISKYTEASALTFTAALSEAQSVMNDPNATQDEATAAATELELALSGLTLKTEPGDSAALESMLDSAIAIETDLFTVESAGALELAIDAAQELAADATQEELNGALADISGAIGGLVLKDEFEPYAQLTDLLIEIAQMDGTLYTKPSWDALQAVVAEAWAFLADI